MIVDGKEYPRAIADLPCPDCAVYMALIPNPYKNGGAVMYRCQVLGCRGSHGAHPDGAPLGVPASKPTKDARILAHDAFDTWRASVKMKRVDAYRFLARQMGLTDADCHIGRFSIPQCRRVLEIVARHGGPPVPAGFPARGPQ